MGRYDALMAIVKKRGKRKPPVKRKGRRRTNLVKISKNLYIRPRRRVRRKN